MSASQAGRRGFDPRLPLAKFSHQKGKKGIIPVVSTGLSLRHSTKERHESRGTLTVLACQSGDLQQVKTQ